MVIGAAAKPWEALSLKDAPIVRAGAPEAGGTVVTTGAVALTAYRGAIAQPKPAFLSQPLLADVINGQKTANGTPAWARAWLVDRMEPSDAFRADE